MASSDTLVADLVKSLTLEEKVSLLAGVDIWHTPEIASRGIGAIKVSWLAHLEMNLSDRR